MAYVDGFITAVPSKNREQYLEFARRSAAVFKEYGALKIVECWGRQSHDQGHLRITRAVACAEHETVVLSWIVWPSELIRNQAIEKIFADPRLHPDAVPSLFEADKMLHGGFDLSLEC